MNIITLANLNSIKEDDIIAFETTTGNICLLVRVDYHETNSCKAYLIYSKNDDKNNLFTNGNALTTYIGTKYQTCETLLNQKFCFLSNIFKFESQEELFVFLLNKSMMRRNMITPEIKALQNGTYYFKLKSFFTLTLNSY